MTRDRQVFLVIRRRLPIGARVLLPPEQRGTVLGARHNGRNVRVAWHYDDSARAEVALPRELLRLDRWA